MSKQNPRYHTTFDYIKNLPLNTSFTLEDVVNRTKEDEKYIKGLLQKLSTKDYYIRKVWNNPDEKRKNYRKIVYYIKTKDFDYSKTLDDIFWFLKYDLQVPNESVESDKSV